MTTSLFRQRADDIKSVDSQQTAEPDVNLHGDACVFKERLERHPHTCVVGVFLDCLAFKPVDSEHQTVRFHRLLADIAKHGNEHIDAVVHSTRFFEAAERKQTASRSPHTNAYVEHFIQSQQQEVLYYLVVFGEQHMDHLVSEAVPHYHEERPP